MLDLTITVPDGSSNHGNPDLLCTPPQSLDYILFYLTNYIAHAATVIMTPGQGTRSTMSIAFFAVFLPGLGIVRALNAIQRRSRFESHPIKRAVRAGAVCMVVKLKGGNTER